MAAAARMLGGQLIGADCRRCQTVPNDIERAKLREINGCDAPAKRAVWRTPCACEADPSCAACGGTGSREFFRCPGSMVDRRPDVDSFVRAWAHYEGRHTLPVDGALLDQTAHFVDACNVMDRERNLWEKRIDENREREAQRKATKR